MASLVEKLGTTLALFTVTLASYQGSTAQEVSAQEVDRDRFCQEFPLNSRCEGYTSSPQAAANEDNQVVKVRLETSGPNNEWIRLEMQPNATGEMVLKAYHTTRSKKGLLSGGIDAALGAVSPVPLPGIFNFYRWGDHQTLSLAFQPDSSPSSATGNDQQKASSCTITGIDSLVLPASADIRTGVFTIGYQEEELTRSIAFRVPSERR